MSKVGQIERKTQDRLVGLFKDHLDYEYLGNWEYKTDNSNINAPLLTTWLKKQGHSSTLINKTLRELDVQQHLVRARTFMMPIRRSMLCSVMA